MNTNDLANRLKFLRAKANYTQSYVCSKIHLSRSSYSNYENGLRVPPLDILKLLAEFYDTSLDYLVGMTDCPEKYPFASVVIIISFLLFCNMWLCKMNLLSLFILIFPI